MNTEFHQYLRNKQRMRSILSRLRKFPQRKKRKTIVREWKRENKIGDRFKDEGVFNRDEMMQRGRKKTSKV